MVSVDDKYELKPCPFCGEKKRIMFVTKLSFDYDEYSHSVQCERCYMGTTDYRTVGWAKRAWNRRAK